MNRPPSWTILDTQLLLEEAPEETVAGLSLLLQGFQDPNPYLGKAREVRFSVRSIRPPVPDEMTRAPEASWTLELNRLEHPPLRIPLPEPDPREVELALVRYAMTLASDVLVLHAAALVLQRRSVLIVGESGAGKTTLSLLLRTHGWTLLSDDLAPFHLSTSRLLPFPRALHVDGKYPPEALDGLLHPSPDFPFDYAPFPLPADQDLFPAREPDLPTCLLHLLPRTDQGEREETLREGDRAKPFPPDRAGSRTLPGSEVAQILHRSMIRSQALEVERALPFLIELGKEMRGFEIEGTTPHATLHSALRALDLSLPPREDPPGIPSGEPYPL